MPLLLYVPRKKPSSFLPTVWTTVDVGNTIRTYRIKEVSGVLYAFPTGWTTTNYFLSSTDGKNWSKIYYQSGFYQGEISDLWKIGTVFYLSVTTPSVSGGLSLWKSTDLKNWTQVPYQAGGYLSYYAYQNNVFSAMYQTPLYSTTLGTAAWTNGTFTPSGVSGQLGGGRMGHGANGVLVYPSTNGYIVKSLNDGKSWVATFVNNNFGASIFGVFAASNNRTILVQNGIYTNENIASSNTWTERKAPGYGVTYVDGTGSNIFAISGGTTMAWRSIDTGINWTAVTLPSAVDCIKFFNGLWVAVRTDGKIMYSDK